MSERSRGGVRDLVWEVRWVLVGILAVGLLVPLAIRDEFLDPPEPELLPDIAPPAEPPVSVIAAPIRVPLGPLVAMLEESVPLRHGDVDEREPESEREEGDRTEISFELVRDPLQVAFDGTTATVHTTVRYAVRAFYDPPILPEISASCGTGEGEPRPRLAVTLRAPITLDTDWRLRTDTRIAGLGAASQTDRDRCTITVIGIDVTGRVMDEARNFLGDHLDDIDSIASGVDLRSEFEDWWGTLQAPIALSDSLWLVMRGEAVRRGPLHGTGDSLVVALSMAARPMIVYGERPELTPAPLPVLDTGMVSTGLDLHVEARAEYGIASRFLTSELRGRSFEAEGRTITLDSLRVFGIGGGRLALEARVSGDVDARLFLVGTPRLRPDGQRLFVPDLEFDVSTRDVVLAAVSWLQADEFRDFLRERADWPAAPAHELLGEWLAKGLNRELSDDLATTGEVESVEITGVHAMRDALLIRIRARGSSRLTVQGER